MDATHNTTQHFAGSANDPIDFGRLATTDVNGDGVVDDRDLARLHDDGGANWPPAEPRDDDYFAATKPQAHDAAHGRASAATAQGPRVAGSSTASRHEQLVDASIASLTDEPEPHDVGNGALVTAATLPLALPAIDWLSSRTIRGVLVSAVAFGGAKLGYAIPDETVQAIVEWLTTIVFAVAALYAIAGRIRATQRIVPPIVTGIGAPASKVVALAMLVTACGALAGCDSGATPAFVAADRARYESIRPLTLDLASGELAASDLSPEERASIVATFDAWDLALRGAGSPTPATQPAQSSSE